MKIVYVYHSIAIWGGLERIFTEKMNYLADSLNYEVFLITSMQGKHPYPYPLSSKITHIDLNIPIHSQYKYKYPLRIWKKWRLNKMFNNELKETIYKINPDIIIGTFYFKADVICNLKCRAKKIIESHTAQSFTGKNDGIIRNPIMKLINDILIQRTIQIVKKKCDVLVTLTKDDALEWYKINNIRVIPNMLSSNMNIIKSTPKVGHAISVGRHEHAKGLDLLRKTCKLVTQKYSNWILDIYGEGPQSKPLKTLINNYNLNQSIIMHSPTYNIQEKYNESEFYILSSRYEGFGLVLIEAMACGIPCIAFDCPYGPSDIIEHGKNGLLVKNGDIQGLADAICWMIEHEEERKQMGVAAKETSKRYAPEVIMKQWDELFKELGKQ